MAIWPADPCVRSLGVQLSWPVSPEQMETVRTPRWARAESLLGPAGVRGSRVAPSVPVALGDPVPAQTHCGRRVSNPRAQTFSLIKVQVVMGAGRGNPLSLPCSVAVIRGTVTWRRAAHRTLLEDALRGNVLPTRAQQHCPPRVYLGVLGLGEVSVN